MNLCKLQHHGASGANLVAKCSRLGVSLAGLLKSRLLADKSAMVMI